MRAKHVTCKLGNMRKAVEWIIYPARENNPNILIQSDCRICSIDPATGKGMLSVHKSGGAYGPHLSPLMGATQVDIPQDLITQLIAEQPHKGDVLMSAGGMKIIAG